MIHAFARGCKNFDSNSRRRGASPNTRRPTYICMYVYLDPREAPRRERNRIDSTRLRHRYLAIVAPSVTGAAMFDRLFLSCVFLSLVCYGRCIGVLSEREGTRRATTASRRVGERRERGYVYVCVCVYAFGGARGKGIQTGAVVGENGARALATARTSCVCQSRCRA